MPEDQHVISMNEMAMSNQFELVFFHLFSLCELQVHKWIKLVIGSDNC